MSEDSIGIESQAQEPAAESAPKRRVGRPKGSMKRAKLRTDLESKALDGSKSKPDPMFRSDSEIMAELDGFGNPLNVTLAPGWKAFWVSSDDLNRHAARAWAPATWGDPRVAEYRHMVKGRDGDVIEYRGLKLYIMREEIAKKYTELDPNRRRHQRVMDYMHKPASEMEGAWQSEAITTTTKRTAVTVDI